MGYKFYLQSKFLFNVSNILKIKRTFLSSAAHSSSIIQLEEVRKNNDDSNEESISTTKILQDLLKKPIFTKDLSKTNEFLYYFNLNVKKYLINEVDNIQNSLKSGEPLTEDQVLQLTHFCNRAGYRVADKDEINAFLSNKYINGIKLSIKSSRYQFIEFFLSNKKLYQEQNMGYISSFNIFKRLTADKTNVILLCKMKKRNEYIFKSFKNVYYHDLMSLLPQTTVLAPAALKLLFMTTLGLSLGSASSYVVSEILFQPSDVYVASFALTTLLSSFFWTQISNLNLKQLWHRYDLLRWSRIVEGHCQLDIFAKSLFPKTFIEALLVYIYLLKEYELLDETNKYVKISPTVKSNIMYWVGKELNFRLWDGFNLDGCLKILQDFRLIECSSESLIHFKVHDLETSSSLLVSNHFRSSIASRFK